MGYDKAEYFVIELTAQIQRSASPPSVSTNWNSAKVVQPTVISDCLNWLRFSASDSTLKVSTLHLDYYPRH